MMTISHEVDLTSNQILIGTVLLLASFEKQTRSPMPVSFPNPFSDLVVDHLKKIIEEGEFHDLSAALDAEINSQIIPEWYQAISISRIYSILLEMQNTPENKHNREKVNALLVHMRKKYAGKINPD